jgi:deoxyadenosine/deoxycytidine kinase
MSSNFVVSIEGNIGSGKTTLLNSLKLEMPEAQVLDEPVGQWSSLKNESGKSLLELFYEDKKRWSYTFQNCAILTRLIAFSALNKREPSQSTVLSERSILTDKYVFAEMLKTDGLLDELEWQLYCMWFDSFGSQYNVSAIIYVNTSPETSFQRILERQRKGEENIPFEYIQRLDQQHKKWLSETSITVLHISTENGVDERENIEKIKMFIENLNHPRFE